MTEQEKAEDNIVKIVLDVIEQIKTIQGKTDMDRLKLNSISEVLRIIGAYIRSIHMKGRKTE
jgi:hypothetical protein